MSLELLSHRLLGALFNGGYQGLLLTLSVWLGLKLLPRSNAATRHAVWFVTLLVVAGLPVAHFFGLPASFAKAAVADVAPVAANPTVTTTPLPDFTSAVKPEERPDATYLAGPLGPVIPAEEPRPAAGVTLTLDGLLAFPEVRPAVEYFRVVTPTPTLADVTAAVAAANENSSTSGDDAEPGAGAAPSLLSRVWQLTLPNRTGLLLAGAWLLLSVIRLGNLGLQLLQLHRLKRCGAAAPVEVRVLFARLSAEMTPGRPTRLLLYPGPGVPMAVGFLRPAVLLPEQVAEEAAAAQLQQVLRHELAHVARRDDWANLAQHVVLATLFFHPAVWWLSRRLTVEREIACDDHVLAATRTPRDYALFLTEFASRMRGRQVVAAPAAWNSTHQLTERIAMILDPKRNASPRLARTSVGLLTTATALIAGLALFGGPRLALAADNDDAAPTATPAEDQEVAETAEISTDQTANEVAVNANTAVVSTVSSDVSFSVPTTTTLVATVTDSESGPRYKVTTSGEAPDVLPVPPSPAQPSQPGYNIKPHVAVAYAPKAPPAPGVSFYAMPAPTPSPAPAGGVHRIVIAHNDAATEVVSDDPSAPDREKREKRGKKEAAENLEHRLDRLEHQMAELLALQRARQGDARRDFQFKLEPGFDQKQFAKAMEDAQRSWPKPEELARIQDDMKRQQEKMAKEMEHAAKDFQRAGAEAAKAAHDESLKQAKDGAGAEKQALEMQRKALEGERHALEKQMNSLERQMERLEQAQEKIDEKAERDREERQERHEKHGDSKPEKAQHSDSSNNNDNDDSAPKKKEVAR